MPPQDLGRQVAGLASPTLRRSFQDVHDGEGEAVSQLLQLIAKGDRPIANHANCPGSKRNCAAGGGFSTSVVVSPRSATTRSKRQGCASARRGLSRRTHTSRPTKAPDIRPHRICFQRLLTYSSTKKTCRSAPTTSTSASTVCMTCHAS